MYQLRWCSLVFILLFSVGTFSQQPNQLSPGDFEKQIADTSNQLLDVRTAEEFRTSHIAHALQADWNNQAQFRDRVQYLHKTKPIYVYCAVGGRSKAAAQWLRSNGFDRVYELKGGFVQWKADSKPVEGLPDVSPMTTSDYKKSITGSHLTLVDIGADWCPPCRKMSPVITQLQQTMPNRFNLFKIDAGVQTIIVKETQVSEFPTFILYKNGNEVWRKQGVATLDELKEAIQKYQ